MIPPCACSRWRAPALDEILKAATCCEIRDIDLLSFSGPSSRACPCSASARIIRGVRRRVGGRSSGPVTLCTGLLVTSAGRVTYSNSCRPRSLPSSTTLLHAGQRLAMLAEVCAPHALGWPATGAPTPGRRAARPRGRRRPAVRRGCERPRPSTLREVAGWGQAAVLA